MYSASGSVAAGCTHRHGVADPRLANVLDPGDQVADLADAEPFGRDRLRRDDADLEQLVRRPGRQHLDALAARQVAVDDPHVGDDAAVDVVHRVEDQGARRRVDVADGRRHLLHDVVEQLANADRRSWR